MDDNLTAVAIVFVVIGVPVLSVFAGNAYKSWLMHQERKLQFKTPQKDKALDEPTVVQLRNEIMQVRQVANEYDLSIQHTLDQIQRRLDFLESERRTKVTYARSSTDSPTVEQSITAGREVEK
jgi:hypothetical protein